MVQCGALSDRPKPIHDEPELAIPTPTKEKKKAKSDTAELMRTAPITIMDDGTVAGCVTDVAGGLSPEEPAAPVVVKTERRKQAYDVEKSECKSAVAHDINKFGVILFSKMGDEKLMEAHLDAVGLCNEKVDVSYVPASEPIIWMARASAASPRIPWYSCPGCLPWS